MYRMGDEALCTKALITGFVGFSKLQQAGVFVLAALAFRVFVPRHLPAHIEAPFA